MNAVHAGLAELDECHKADFATLAMWADACEDAGEIRLAEVARWMLPCEERPNGKWPGGTERVWLGCVGEGHHRIRSCLGPLWQKIAHPQMDTRHATFRDALEAASVYLHLQSFEHDPTPNHAAAKECADWLERHTCRLDLARGMRWLCDNEKWPWYEGGLEKPWGIDEKPYRYKRQDGEMFRGKHPPNWSCFPEELVERVRQLDPGSRLSEWFDTWGEAVKAAGQAMRVIS